ncbi:MAG: BatD family protein [Ekhidna sp.]|nr:BatD family protein [Ekhidna sp.]
MGITKNFWIGLVLFIITSLSVNAQDVSVKLGKTEIALNEYFTITIRVANDRLKKYSNFPDIEGFNKRGTSTSTSTNIVNGRMSSTQSLTQNYQAIAKGNFVLRPFTMSINGKQTRSEGTSIKVGEPVQRQSGGVFGRDPFDDFFGNRSNKTEFVDVKADAFAALTVDKNEVYVGEGFTATLAFYVAASNRAEMRFHDLSNQITEIVKKVKPSNCWEENFSIDQIAGDPVKINGRNYTQYKIYQTAYYPLTAQDIEFPSVGLKMIKYKVAKNPSFFGRNRQEDYETFYSREKIVKVKALPAHPLKDKVAVGNYRLDEVLSVTSLETGQSFNYAFNIVGEGNISSIEAPSPPENENFDFYEPDVRQNINRGRGKVSGTKSFNFYGIPSEPGTFDLGAYFSWVFFNPSSETYDTLKSELTLQVTGESRKNLSIASNDLGDFYDRISKADNQLRSLNEDQWINIVINILAVFILGTTIYLFFKKPTA